MGPRLLSRGESDYCQSVKLCERCFNGAAASQPRRVLDHHPIIVLEEPFQWGRGFSAAERPC